MSGQVLVRYLSLPNIILYARTFVKDTLPIEDNLTRLSIGVFAG